MIRRALILAALLAALPAAAVDYYVATTGTGTACTNPATGGTPCALSQINATNLGPNDNVILAAGTYCGTRLTLTSEDSGASGNPITIRGATGVRTDVILSGLSCTDIDDAAAVRCDTAGNCPDSGTPSNTYRIPFTGNPTSGHVWETNWTVGRVHVYDTNTANRSSYDMDDPGPYSEMGSFGAVNGLAGSYMRNGTFIWVHLFENGDPVTAGVNLRFGDLGTGDGVLSATDASWVRYQDFSIMYGNILSYLHNNCDDLVFSNMKWASARAAGFYASASTGASDRVTISNSLVSVVHNRDGTASGTKDEGWDLSGNGDCFSVSAAAGSTPTGWDIDYLDIHSCWNGMKFARLTNSTLSSMLLEGSVNHMWRIDEGVPSPFTNVLVETSIIINAQESINPRCADPMPKFHRNALGGTGINNDICALTAQTFLGNLLGGELYLGNEGTNGPDGVIQWGGSDSGNYRSDYNQLPSDATEDCCWRTSDIGACNQNGSDRDCGGPTCGLSNPSQWTLACQAEVPHPIACDEHSICNVPFVALAAFNWPLVKRQVNYLGDHAVRTDFCPVSGSPLIDAGNPDIDLDGTLETGVGGDDECTTAHHCYGAAPDIGPCEWGIDVPGGTPHCADLIDNDGDGFTDLADIGCTSGSDTSETQMPGSTWTIPCTSSGYIQALADACTTGGGKTVNFNCTSTTISIPLASITGDALNLTCNNNIIDGENKGITFEPTTRWAAATDACGNQACEIGTPNGIPDRCPDCSVAGACGDAPFTSEQTPRFMILRGDNNVVRDFDIAHWMDGFRFDSGSSDSATGNVVSGIVCDYPGDTCFSGDPPGAGVSARLNTYSGVTARNACDKAIQIYGRNSGWANAADYDIKLDNVICENVGGCIRSNDNGYYVVNNLIVREVSPGAIFNCDYGLWSSGSGLGGLYDINGMTTTGCNDSIIAQTDTQIALSGGVFDGNAIRAEGTSIVSVDTSSFNSGTGVSVTNGTPGEVDLGGGCAAASTGSCTSTNTVQFGGPLGAIASGGGNNFAGATIGVANGRGGYTVRARCATWDDLDPSNEVTGSVDYSPVGSCCGDGLVSGSESCDGSGACGTSGVVCGSDTCATLGFAGGSLACAACAWNTTSCSGSPSGVHGIHGGLCAGCRF